MEYFKRSLDLSKEMGLGFLVSKAEEHLARALSSYQGCEEGDALSHRSCVIPIEEKVKRQRDMYALSIELCGEDGMGTIKAGIDLALVLKGAGRGIEAERLFSKLAATSHRIHGLDHEITKRAERHLQECKTRCVNVRRSHGMELFEVLGYDVDGEKLHLQGPIVMLDVEQFYQEHRRRGNVRWFHKSSLSESPT